MSGGIYLLQSNGQLVQVSVLTIDTSMNAKAQFEPPYGPVPVSKVRTLAS
jgi:hypothetical protein